MLARVWPCLICLLCLLVAGASHPATVAVNDDPVPTTATATITPTTIWTTVSLPLVLKPQAPATPTATLTPTATPTATSTPTATPTATSATPVSPIAHVRIAPTCSQFNAPGNDHDNLNEEYVCFENQGVEPANMADAHVRDEADCTYDFPPFTLAAGGRVKLHTGWGTDTATDLYWGRSSAVWNNGGDTVYLYDADWNLVDEYSYANAPEPDAGKSWGAMSVDY